MYGPGTNILQCLCGGCTTSGPPNSPNMPLPLLSRCDGRCCRPKRIEQRPPTHTCIFALQPGGPFFQARVGGWVGVSGVCMVGVCTHTHIPLLFLLQPFLLWLQRGARGKAPRRAGGREVCMCAWVHAFRQLCRLCGPVVGES